MQQDEPLFYAEVAPAVPVKKNLHYQVPSSLREKIEVGSRVLVPLGKRKVTAYVIALPASSNIERIKPIEKILDSSPLFSLSDLSFFRWIASYYCCSLGEVIKNALPSGINVKTDRHISITPQGLKALTDQNLSHSEEQLLVRLEGKSAVAVKSLLKSLKYKKILPMIASLLHKNYITMTQCQRSSIVTSRKEKVFQVNEEIISTLPLSDWKGIVKKAPRQYEILKWLWREGKTPQKSIVSRWGRVESTLRALEKKKLVVGFFREMYRKPFLVDEEYDSASPPEMTSEQSDALQKIVSSIREKKYASFLLHGITGSGKTEVYIRAIEATIETGRGAIMLVPEIALTPQFISIFQARFGDKIAQLHSGLSQGERFDEWRRIRNKEVQIVIGARSAIFAPLDSPGIIVVDEEHDSAYKQDQRTCYNARDLALVKGKMNNAVVILGSATPMLETYYNTKIGKINYLHLSHRINNRPLPRIEVVDMRNEKSGVLLTPKLINAIRKRWGRREQTLLFLNRRGFAPFVMCQKCGYTLHCSNCDVSLVYHHNKRALLCHYCNYYIPAPDTCPHCRSHKVKKFGFGTEKLEKEVLRHFPAMNVGRLDKDTTAKRNSLQHILRQFRTGKTDLLIGTQMIALGHDLPRVTLVGIIAADQSLNFPDFRAGEKTFQLLTQVAGRSGRGRIPGKVIIQTYNPHYPSIRMAITQNFQSFYEQEIAHRKDLDYPPFSRLVNFRIIGRSLVRTRKFAAMLGKLTMELKHEEDSFQNTIEILGPAEAPWEKLKGNYRWQMLVKGRNRKILHRFAEKIIIDVKPQIKISGVQLSVDVDPINLL